MTEAVAHDPFGTAVLVAAVTRLEADGPLDDHALLPRVLAADGDRTQQVQTRALLLAERLGLPRELARIRGASRWVALAIAAALALLGLAAAGRVLAPSHQINAVAALAGLVGVNLCTLLIWCGALLWPHRAPAAAGAWSLGRWALVAGARLPWLTAPHRIPLLGAMLHVLRRGRLALWAMGVFSHTIWATASALALLALLFGFAFQSYELTWQTTILTPGFFARFVHAVGALPAALGIPVPSAAVVQQTAFATAPLDPAAQRAWAWWLIGCLLTYGLLPRIVLALISLWRLRVGLRTLPAVDRTAPAVQRVLRRLDALACDNPIVDPEHRGDGGAQATPALPPVAGLQRLLGFELPPEWAWPPAGLPSALPAQRISGGGDDTERALAELAAAPPAALVVTVAAAASPDRGTARFLRQASAQAGATALWLLSASGAADPAASARWQRWFAEQGLGAWPLLQTAPAVVDWLRERGASPSGDASPHARPIAGVSP